MVVPANLTNSYHMWMIRYLPYALMTMRGGRGKKKKTKR